MNFWSVRTPTTTAVAAPLVVVFLISSLRRYHRIRWIIGSQSGVRQYIHCSLLYPPSRTRCSIFSVSRMIFKSSVSYHFLFRFLPERDYVTFGSLLSQIRLSSVCLPVCNVHASYSGVEAFSNISSPLCTLAILWPPCKIIRRSSQGNPCVRGI